MMLFKFARIKKNLCIYVRVSFSKKKEKSSDFLAAKLYYKMLSYKFEGVTSEQIFESNFTEPKKPLTKFNIQDNDA